VLQDMGTVLEDLEPRYPGLKGTLIPGISKVAP
jgi:hypothetical protein